MYQTGELNREVADMHDRRPTQMCGRVTLIIAERRMVAETLGVDRNRFLKTSSRYNIAQTDQLSSSRRSMSSGAQLERAGAS